MGLLKRLWGFLIGMIRPDKIKNALERETLVTDEYANKIELWQGILNGQAEWNDDDTPSLNIAEMICRSNAITATIDADSELLGNDFLNEQYGKAFNFAADALNYTQGLGKSCFLFYRSGEEDIDFDFFTNGTYYPLRYGTNGALEACVFTKRMQAGKNIYTLVSIHDWKDRLYTITNSAYVVSESSKDKLGNKISLTSVDQWAEIEQKWQGYCEMPWFVEMSMKDGLAFYHKAIPHIRKADRHDANTEIEFENAESEIFRPTNTLENQGGSDGATYKKPEKKRRVYTYYDSGGGFNGDDKIHIYNPAIRHEAYSKRLQEIYWQIENSLLLARGTISEILVVEQRVDQIKARRLKNHVLYTSLQDLLEGVYKKIAYILHDIAVFYGFNSTEFTITFHWDDSTLLTDEEKFNLFVLEKEQKRKDYLDGIVSRERYWAWVREHDPTWHTITEDVMKEAEAELPAALDIMGGT